MLGYQMRLACGSGSRIIQPLVSATWHFSRHSWLSSNGYLDAMGSRDIHERRIDGVIVRPTSNPPGKRKRGTVCPHGSFLFLTRIR